MSALVDLVDEGAPAVADCRVEGWDFGLGGRLRITVDGVEPRYVYAWNAEEGWLAHMPPGPDGLKQLAPDKRDAVRETLHGRVEVRWK